MLPFSWSLYFSLTPIITLPLTKEKWGGGVRRQNVRATRHSGECAVALHRQPRARAQRAAVSVAVA